MTEAEWMTCSAPAQMVKHLASVTNHRKLRLFAVACCRRIWNLIPVTCSGASSAIRSDLP